MEKEDRELLLQDLCARLPYGVICEGKYCDVEYDIDGGIDMFDVHGVLEAIFMTETIINSYCCDIETVKPYLRPMSSMTGEEKKDFLHLINWDENDLTDIIKYPHMYEFTISIKAFNWLNKNHFDYRGLIPMGLAIEAPENMYKNRK